MILTKCLTNLIFQKKPYIINTSRGEIVDEKIYLLKKQKISGYATDVLEHEFLAKIKVIY